MKRFATVMVLAICPLTAESPAVRDLFVLPGRIGATVGAPLRAAAATDAAVLTNIPKGAAVQLIDLYWRHPALPGSGPAWYKVRLGQMEGWVLAAAVQAARSPHDWQVAREELVKENLFFYSKSPTELQKTLGSPIGPTLKDVPNQYAPSEVDREYRAAFKAGVSVRLYYYTAMRRWFCLSSAFDSNARLRRSAVRIGMTRTQVAEAIGFPHHKERSDVSVWSVDDSDTRIEIRWKVDRVSRIILVSHFG